MNALTLSRHSSWETCSEQEESSLPATQNDGTLRRRRYGLKLLLISLFIMIDCYFVFNSLGRNPIRSRKSFKDRPTSVYSGKSSASSVEENCSSLPVGEFQSDVGFYYDLDGNVQSEDATLMDSCGNIPASSIKQEISRLDLVAVDSHSFA
jgi:hypothetical protein